MRRSTPAGRSTPLKITRQLHVFFVAFFFVLPACAQDSTKNAAASNLAASPSAGLLEQWNEIGRKLIAMAEDFPEGKYDYKPAPESRTFRANLLHAAASMYYFTDIANGKKPRYPDDPKQDNLKTKDQLVGFVKQCVADGADVISKKGDQGMTEVVDDGGPHLDRLYDV